MAFLGIFWSIIIFSGKVDHWSERKQEEELQQNCLFSAEWKKVRKQVLIGGEASFCLCASLETSMPSTFHGEFLRSFCSCKKRQKQVKKTFVFNLPAYGDWLTDESRKEFLWLVQRAATMCCTVGGLGMGQAPSWTPPQVIQPTILFTPSTFSARGSTGEMIGFQSYVQTLA